MNHASANRLAEQFMLKYCTDEVCYRVSIAGSIRRGKPEPGDIEVVCQPILGGGLFAPVPKFYHQLDTDPPGKVIKAGSKYRQYDLGEIKLDVFIVTPPAQWGVIMAIRTGPARLSKLMVTQRAKGGLLPSYARVESGSVIVGPETVPMSEEIDFLNFIGMGDISPQERERKYA